MQFPNRSGWVEVIWGPMFSGKTQELINRLRTARHGGLNVMAFRPKLDSRSDPDHIQTHDAARFEAIEISDIEEIVRLVRQDTNVVGIDEVQFFPDFRKVVEVCDFLAARGVRVIVAGLDLDYNGEPFETVMQLAARAEYTDKRLAMCPECGNVAGRSKRLVNGGDRIQIGGEDEYGPRCRHCISS